MTPRDEGVRERETAAGDTRPLGGFERASALTHAAWPFLAVGVICLERGPSDASLRQALDAMQARTPLLRTRVVRGRFVTHGTPRVPLELRARAGDDDWQAAAEALLNHRLDSATGPLLRACYLRPEHGRGPAEILLGFQHTVIDATSGQEWVGQLLRRCAEPASAPDGAEGGLPPATDALLPDGYRGLRGALRRSAYFARELGGELAYRVRPRHWALPPPIGTTATCRILRGELPCGPTRALIGESRRRRVTLNSALNAALNLAVWRRVYAARPMSFRALAFVDLRAHLQPPVPTTTLGCHIAMMRCQVELRPGQGFWDVARAFQRRLHDPARRGDKFLAPGVTPHLMRATLRSRAFRLSETALSYSGALQLAPAYGPFHLRGLHAFVSNIPMGPVFSALARLDQDRILWDYLYLAEDMDRDQATALADTVLETVEDAVRPRGAVRAPAT